MSDLERDCLRMLRVFGPVSNAEIARRLSVPRWKTYPYLYRLCLRGYACHPGHQRWDITEEGRRVFAAAPNKPLVLWRE